MPNLRVTVIITPEEFVSHKWVCDGFRQFFYKGHPSKAYIRLNG